MMRMKPQEHPSQQAEPAEYITKGFDIVNNPHFENGVIKYFNDNILR